MESNGKSPAENPYIVPVILLILIPVFLSLLPQAQSNSAIFFLRVLAALGGGLVGNYISGQIGFDGLGARATGALAVFLIIFLLNPPDLVKSLKIETITCTENETKCKEGKVISCLIAGEDKDGPVKNDHPLSMGNGFVRYDPAWIPSSVIDFGEWKNTECEKEGTGWHIVWGSCGKGTGTKFKRCTQVTAEVLR